MISKKTKSFNLINHLKQKNIEYNVNLNFCSERGTPKYLNWVGEFYFNNKKYEVIGKRKRDVTQQLINKAEEDIYKLVLKK